MKESTIYTCEYCGERFLDKDKAAQHEAKCIQPIDCYRIIIEEGNDGSTPVVNVRIEDKHQQKPCNLLIVNTDYQYNTRYWYIFTRKDDVLEAFRKLRWAHMRFHESFQAGAKNKFDHFERRLQQGDVGVSL